MVIIQSLSIYQPVEESGNHWLDRPNRSNNADIDVGKMTVIHSQKYACLNSKKETTLDAKSE